MISFFTSPIDDFQSYISSLPKSTLQYLECVLDWDHGGVNKDLNEIAYKMIHWEEKLSDLLELNEIDIHDIKAKYSHEPKLRR